MTDELSPLSPLPVAPVDLAYARPRMAPLEWPYTAALWIVCLPTAITVISVTTYGLARFLPGIAVGIVCIFAFPLAWLLALGQTIYYSLQGRHRELDPKFLRRRRNLIAMLCISFVVMGVCGKFALAIMEGVSSAAH